MGYTIIIRAENWIPPNSNYRDFKFLSYNKYIHVRTERKPNGRTDGLQLGRTDNTKENV